MITIADFLGIRLGDLLDYDGKSYEVFAAFRPPRHRYGDVCDAVMVVRTSVLHEEDDLLNKLRVITSGELEDVEVDEHITSSVPVLEGTNYDEVAFKIMDSYGFTPGNRDIPDIAVAVHPDTTLAHDDVVILLLTDTPKINL